MNSISELEFLNEKNVIENTPYKTKEAKTRKGEDVCERSLTGISAETEMTQLNCVRADYFEKVVK